jgi:MFS transporter, DHA2 family, multidrug resistance protein
VLYGSIVLIPLFMQELLGFPAITAGFWNSPRGVATLVLMPLAGFLIDRCWDMRGMLFGGLLVSVVGVWMFSLLDLGAGPWNFLWPQLLMGAGLSLVFPPLATITVDPIPSQEMGYATSVIALMRNVGASIGISAVDTELARRRQAAQVELVKHVRLGNCVFRGLLEKFEGVFRLHGSGPAQAMHQAMALIYRATRQQAALLSYIDGFQLLAILFGAVAPLVWVMRKHHAE